MDYYNIFNDNISDKLFMKSNFISGINIVFFLALSIQVPVYAQQSSGEADKKVIDNFETYETGTIADRWKYITKSGDELPVSEALEEGERFHVMQEDGNKYLRVETQNESIRLSQVNGSTINWNIQQYPYLKWKWRAQYLPQGASEKDKNDSGGAIYVTFGTDWLGRPKSIKYTYSSSLPVGTKVGFGSLTVIVASSAAEGSVGDWKTVERDLLDDYEDVFGGFLKKGTPPDRPLSITIWGDSDSTNDSSKVDFDDIMLLKEPSM